MSLTRKGLLVILDGLGDSPHPALGGRTPLEAAWTPFLDELAARGRCGVTDPLEPGVPVDTPTGTSVLLGVPQDEVEVLARGPVEAAGVGLHVNSGDVAIRCNFATLEDGNDGLLIADRRAGRIREGTAELAHVISDIDLGAGIRATVHPASQHRAVLRLTGPDLSGHISDTDPGGSARGVRVLPCRPLQSDAASERTAAAVNRFLYEAHRRLARHPLNAGRVAGGEPPANGIITRGAGRFIQIGSILHRYGARATVVVGEKTVVGLARLLGFEVISRPGFTGMPDTDLDGKVAAAVEAIPRSDIVFLHVKGPDICAHDRDPVAKRELLERVDAALARLPTAELVIAVCGDHSTDSTTGDHSGNPVPALLAEPGGGQDGSQAFDEITCAGGRLGRLSASAFLERFLEALGAVPEGLP